MNPGPVEEGGKVATGVIDALRGNPAMLAIIVLNLLILGLVYYATREARSDFVKTINLMIEKQDRVAQLLYNCVPASKTGIDIDLLKNPYLDHDPPHHQEPPQ